MSGTTTMYCPVLEKPFGLVAFRATIDRVGSDGQLGAAS